MPKCPSASRALPHAGARTEAGAAHRHVVGERGRGRRPDTTAEGAIATGPQTRPRLPPRAAGSDDSARPGSAWWHWRGSAWLPSRGSHRPPSCTSSNFSRHASGKESGRCLLRAVMASCHRNDSQSSFPCSSRMVRAPFPSALRIHTRSAATPNGRPSRPNASEKCARKPCPLPRRGPSASWVHSPENSNVVVS